MSIFFRFVDIVKQFYAFVEIAKECHQKSRQLTREKRLQNQMSAHIDTVQKERPSQIVEEDQRKKFSLGMIFIFL